MSFKLKKAGQTIEFPEKIVNRCDLLVKLQNGIPIQTPQALEFKATETDLDPAPGKDFSIETLKKVQEFLEGFTFPDGKAPPNLKKPLLIFVTFNDWLDHGFEEQKREWLENFLKPKSFYDLVEMFNAAFYLQIKDLKEIVAARIAHSIILERKAPEDFLRDFGIVTEYQNFFTPEQEKVFIDKEFINKNDFEGVAADDDEDMPQENK